LDVRAQKLYDNLPHWKVGSTLDVADFNAVSEGLDFLLDQVVRPSPKMPHWGNSPRILASELNCWVDGLAILQGILQDALTWPKLGISRFEDGKPFDAHHLMQIVDCIFQAFRFLAPARPAHLSGIGEGWDDDPLSL